MHRRTAVAVCGLLLAGCAGMSLEQQSSIVPATLVQRGKAVIVVSASVKLGQGHLFTHWAASGRPPPSDWTGTALAFRTLGQQNVDHPTIAEVDAGSYDMIRWEYRSGNMAYSNRGKILPGMWLARVKVAPGDVVYIGHVDFQDRPPNDYALAVVDAEERVRAVLADSRPEIASVMVKRLMTINPTLAGAPQTADAIKALQ